MKLRAGRAALLLFLIPLIADAAFYFTREAQLARLGPEISYRVDDPAKPMSFETVASDTTGWISQKDRPFPGAKGSTSLWIRFEIPPGISTKRVFFNVPAWEEEEFFVVRDGALVGRHKAGAGQRWKEREVQVSLMAPETAGFVEVEQVPGKPTTVFGHVSTENRIATAEHLFVRVWDPDRVLQAERQDRLIQGLFYGVMFFLITYNLAIFLVVREASFLYYVIMEAGFAMGWGSLMGLTFEYLVPDHPYWELHYMWVGSVVGGFAGWQFLRHYLDMPRRYPKLNRLLMVLAYINLPLIPLTFLGVRPETLQDILVLPAPVGAAALIGVTAFVVKRRHPAALNLLIAMSCLGFGFTLFSGAAAGWLPVNNWTMHGGQLGSVLAGIILSMGLGYRLQEERTRLSRLKRFLSPKVSELIAAGQLDDPLATRRREVTIVFVDLRGFTAFSETAAPEDVLGVLREYHAEVGRLVGKYEGTIEHFAGDGVMIIFNDPAPLPDPALAAVSFAVELRDNVSRLAESWRRLGHQLACGLGIAQGYATIGTIGFEGRQDYGVIGAVNNLAARLCAQAAAGQVLVSQRVFGRVEDKVVAEPVGELTLKGIHAPVPAFNVVAMRSEASTDAPAVTLATQQAELPAT